MVLFQGGNVRSLTFNLRCYAACLVFGYSC
jgi:hypothetical protein